MIAGQLRASARSGLRLARHSSLWLTRVVVVALLLAVILVGAAAVLLRQWVLPNINDFRDQVAAAISRAANQRVTIGALEGSWDGLHPRLAIHDLRVYDAAGTERMALATVNGTLSWLSLLGEVRFQTISARQLALEVRRDHSGRFFIAGMPMKQDGGGGGFGDWLLAQQRIDLSDSAFTWVDETLGGVPLALQDVQLQIEKRRGTWYFALRANPPSEAGAPIDLRGQLTRGSFGERLWSGKLYFHMSHVDLAALRQWIALPGQFSTGVGAIEVWATLDASRVKDVMADLALANVRLRLAPKLPYLDLSRMSGRLAWSRHGEITDVSARQLTFTTPDGLRLPPGDFRFRRQGGEEDPQARSELRFNVLNVAALMRLADRLPLDERLRARLSQMSPRGTVRDFQFSWAGPLESRQSYQLQAAFESLAVSPSGYLPGFSSVTGSIQATERGGSVSLRAGPSELLMPKVFALPLPLHSFDGQVSWTNRSDGQLVRIERAVFSNEHLAGRAAGTYQSITGQPGVIDLTGSLERGDGHEAWRYVPLRIDEKVREWLRESIVQAYSQDVQFKLRGDLRRFPFTEPQSGVFEMRTQFDRGILAFAPGWPRIEGIRGELIFSGASMTVSAPQGQVYGVVLKDVTARIADLKSRDVTLEVRGQGEGPTQDFLRYIEQSEVDRFLHGFTRGMRAGGRGTLTLSVDLPLHRLDQPRVAGSYRFANNMLEPGHGAPRLEDLNGELRFTEQDVRAQDVSVTVLGMPARVSLGREGERVVIRGRGRADTAALRRIVEQPLSAYLSGSAEWGALLAVHDGGYELTIDSDLRGLASTLPAPLAKDPAQPLPLRLYRRSLDADRELLTLSVGSVLSAQIQQRRREGPSRILRGELRLGEPAPAPQRDGLWFGARTARLDFDRWWSVLSGAPAGGPSAMAGVELHVGELRAYGRIWHELELSARREQQWQVRLSAREVSGTAQFDPTGDGSLSAHLARLYVPQSTPELQAAPVTDETPQRLPAIDLSVDDFRFETRNLGQLKLLADNEPRGWRIRQLVLSSPQGTLDATGVWQLASRTPSTRIDFTLEMSDVGAYLARLQLPPGVKGGRGRIAGNISWNGAPLSIDLPTLSGAVQIEAKKGRFVKIEPGLGKLIGVISLQALPRRVSLDFRDVFSEGFAFDQIGGNVSISRGVAHTQDFFMIGPAARVEMKGDVNLAGETQRLDVKVLPALSESVALGAALLNPAVGIAALLAQKALKDPLSHLAAFDYEISGTWSDPIVMKKRRENPLNSRNRR